MLHIVPKCSRYFDNVLVYIRTVMVKGGSVSVLLEEVPKTKLHPEQAYYLHSLVGFTARCIILLLKSSKIKSSKVNVRQLLEVECRIY
jgi:hypothetical protein